MTSSARNHVIVYLIYDVTITTSEYYHHKSLAKYLSVSRYLHIFFAVFYIYQVVCVTCCFFHIFSVVIINLAGVCGINRIFYSLWQCIIRNIRFRHLPLPILSEPCRRFVSIIEICYIIS